MKPVPPLPPRSRASMIEVDSQRDPHGVDSSVVDPTLAPVLICDCLSGRHSKWTAIDDRRRTSAMPRAGDDRVSFTVAANGGAARSARITVRDKSVRDARERPPPHAIPRPPVDCQPVQGIGCQHMAPEKTDVLYGTLALMILKTLDAMGPLHGYGLARRIEQVSENQLALEPGDALPGTPGSCSRWAGSPASGARPTPGAAPGSTQSRAAAGRSCRPRPPTGRVPPAS